MVNGFVLCVLEQQGRVIMLLECQCINAVMLAHVRWCLRISLDLGLQVLQHVHNHDIICCVVGGCMNQELLGP